MNFEHKDYGLFIIWMQGLTLYDTLTDNAQTLCESIQLINKGLVFTYTKPVYDNYIHFNKVHYTELEAKVSILGEVSFTAKKVGRELEGLSTYALNRLDRTLAKDLLARTRSQERYLRTTLRNIYINDAKRKIGGLIDAMGDRHSSKLVEYMDGK